MSEITLQLSDIPPTRPTKAYRTIYAVVVSIHFGSPPRMYVTDMTSNPIIATSYAYNNYVGTTDDEIPNEKILQVIVYPEKFIPFMKELESKRNVTLYVKEHAKNLLNYGLFVKMQLRMKWYNNTLEGIVDKIEILDRSADLCLPVFKNVVQGLPTSYVTSDDFQIEETVPIDLIKQWLNERNQPTDLIEKLRTNNQKDQYIALSTPQKQVISPTTKQSPSTPLQLNQSTLFSSELPSDENHQLDYLLSNQEPVNHPYTQVTSTEPQRRKHITVGYLRKLNSVDLVDGKVYDVSGIIAEIEPLLGQLCTKISPDSTPVLNPITILIKANLKHAEEEETIRISLISKAEIFAFFSLSEIEQVYIYSNKLWGKLQGILKGKKIQDFKIMRKLIRIGRCSILGWEPVDLKLDRLTE